MKDHVKSIQVKKEQVQPVGGAEREKKVYEAFNQEQQLKRSIINFIFPQAILNTFFYYFKDPDDVEISSLPLIGCTAPRARFIEPIFA